MDEDRIESAFVNAISGHEGDYHDDVFGEYHPSHVSGCPLGAVIDFMTEKEIPTNNYMWNGKTTHYYLQETGILKEALHDAGYHWLDTSFEITNRHKVAPGVHLVGRCDAICYDNETETSAIIDIKYTSLKSHYNSGRLYKYATQVNTYCGMFGADEWGLLMLYSKTDDVESEDFVDMLTNEFNEDNWANAKQKAKNIHSCLDHFGYDDGERWNVDWLKQQDRGFWEEAMEFFNPDNVPFYDGELKYSDRDEWVMPYMTNWDNPSSGGLNSFRTT